MNVSLAGAILLASVLLLIAGISCRAQATPVPIPASEPVEQVYSFYQREKEDNPNRLDWRVENNEIKAFHGTITEIDGSKMQFHISRRLLEGDEYIECEFPNENYTLDLSEGESAYVYGWLDDVNGAIKFKGCQLDRR